MARKANAGPAGSGSKQVGSRDCRGRFAKGVSGNARGRPRGSRSRAMLIAEQLLLDDSREMTQQMISLAKSGNFQALRFCLERVLPQARERPLEANLYLENPADVGEAMTALADQIGSGAFTPSEILALCAFLAHYPRRYADAEAAADKKKFAEMFAGLV